MTRHLRDKLLINSTVVQQRNWSCTQTMVCSFSCDVEFFCCFFCYSTKPILTNCASSFLCATKRETIKKCKIKHSIVLNLLTETKMSGNKTSGKNNRLSSFLLICDPLIFASLFSGDVVEGGTPGFALRPPG
ncbi:hypothetical protein QOT17_011066 [Balamuthia mandrillaris]